MSAMHTISDQQQRQRALDPTQSFIVQAPAGSGKTELLTQRFLVLLSKVKQPEEILAITFTKKSAAEMRARIINALKNATCMTEPEVSHAKTTWHLAKAALQRDKILNWHLLENPNRLRIQTIDSMNAYLTKQLPILSHFGAPPDIIDDPTALYRSAVQEFLMHLEEKTDWSQAIAQLLLHMDNDLNKIQTLLMNLLEKRDQWLPYITQNTNDSTLRVRLEGYLEETVTDALTTLTIHFPKEHVANLVDLADFAANNLLKENSQSLITQCAHLTTLPGVSANDKMIWLGLSELLLTKDGQWRKQFNKITGFPAATSTKNPNEKNLLDEMKQRMICLVNALQSHTPLFSALTEIRLLPDHTYQETQWQILDSLHQLLYITVAQLKLVFQQRGKIDYIESAQAALAALGTEEAPTDLLLALDYQIQHILIDEFQDTSNSQYRLIERLTTGWTAHDGRTLFVVGDPMQSIYRFREAEVGYFIRAQQAGLNHIYLEPLTLSVNFRSLPGIVNWVNQHFQRILPLVEDIATGAITYSPSISVQTDSPAPAVELHAFINSPPSEQAESITQLIQKLKSNNPDHSIAILVRSRTHLAEVIPALKKAQLPYKAIDIDPLTTRPIVRDLMALTHALIHLADRIAWLAILRAPWCGLSLSDLLMIAGDHSRVTIWEQLQKKSVLLALSTEGQQRLSRILPILQTKIADRHRFSLRSWLESTWLLLGGPACTEQASDLTDAEAYFTLLEKLDRSGELPNLDELEQHVNRLYAAPNNQADNTLQIMTIHNAKGLEFDTVILPHLERRSSHDDKQLLLWMERPRPQQHNALLIAPLHATGQSSDSIYDYIKRQHAIKNDHENGRLLYVATTRAKKRLHLFFSLKQEKDKIIDPAPNSLLEKLWIPLSQEIENKAISHFHTIHYNHQQEPASANNKKEVKTIHRLTLDWTNPIVEQNKSDTITYHQKQSGFQLQDNHPKYIGIFLHQVLQQICLNGPSWWEKSSLENKNQYCQYHLTQLGVLPIQLDSAIETIFTAINNTLQDTQGRWIIKSHQEAESEFPLTAIIDNQVKSFIIDRTFIDENETRWIIDYKSSDLRGENRELFLQKEKDKYINQLTQYAKAMANIDQRPIRLGLYFPLLPAWIEY